MLYFVTLGSTPSSCWIHAWKLANYVIASSELVLISSANSLKPRMLAFKKISLEASIACIRWLPPEVLGGKGYDSSADVYVSPVYPVLPGIW